MGSFSLVHILILLVTVPIGFLPSIVAAARMHPRMLWILLVNIFLAWTFVGWIGALVWSLLPISRSRVDEL